MRVAVRLRPKNAEDFSFDADFTDCVELQSEVFTFQPIKVLKVFLLLSLKKIKKSMSLITNIYSFF